MALKLSVPSLFLATAALILGLTEAPSQPLPLDLASLSVRWWQWRVSLPELVVPDKDTAGHFCDVGQPRDVWFLAGLLTINTSQPVHRHCIVPAGRPIFFPVVTAFRITHGDVTCAKAQAEVSTTIDRAKELYAVLDGKDLPISARDRSSTKGACLPLNFAADGPSSQLTAAADGYWLSVGPLPSGRHTLVYGGSMTASGTEPPRRQNTTYDLEIR